MGLIDYARRKAGIWYWRARYWWMDTDSGREARVVAFAALLLLSAVAIVRTALQPVPPAEPQQALVWWAQLLIAVVSMALSLMLRPKMPKQPEPKFQGPQVEDGLIVDNYYGTHWHEDEAMLAWAVTGKQKIKGKGKK